MKASIMIESTGEVYDIEIQGQGRRITADDLAALERKAEELGGELLINGQPAGEQRDVVSEISEAMKARGLSIYADGQKISGSTPLPDGGSVTVSREHKVNALCVA